MYSIVLVFKLKNVGWYKKIRNKIAMALRILQLLIVECFTPFQSMINPYIVACCGVSGCHNTGKFSEVVSSSRRNVQITLW